jgi:uncharacterized protein YjbI with pentapeptide repeats
VNLDRATLSGAKLIGAEFGPILIRGTRDQLWPASLLKVRFDQADLVAANFSGAKLRDASFCGANLKGAKFGGADLSGADFTDANCEGADFSGASTHSTRGLVAPAMH